MILFGVSTLEKLRNGNTNTIFGRRRIVSVTLLNQLDASRDSESLYDRIMLELMDDSGIYKRTSKHRFPKFDLTVIDILKERQRNSVATLLVHDTAVSNARTSVDFFSTLIRSVKDIKFMATDYDPLLTVITSGVLSVTVSSRLVPVEVLFPPFVFASRRLDNPILHPINYLVRKALSRRVKSLISKYASGDRDVLDIDTICLFCPTALRMSDECDEFELGTYDILEPCLHPEKFSCVRMMNVLNPTYFSEEKALVAVRNAFDSLELGGVFVAGSNQESDSDVHGGIFRREENGFRLLYSSGSNEFLNRLVRRVSGE